MAEEIKIIITMSIIFIGLAMFVGGMLISRAISKKRTQEKIQCMIAEANAFFATAKSEERFCPITTNLLLKKGEQAYLEAVCSLNETRSTRHYQRGGVGFRVAKGVYVGGSKGTSYSVPQITPVDSGKLILTNKRLVFDGGHENRNITLNKIASITHFIDAIEVSLETRQKSMYFTVENPFLWDAAIRILSVIDDPNNITGDTFDIDVA